MIIMMIMIINSSLLLLLLLLLLLSPPSLPLPPPLTASLLPSVHLTFRHKLTCSLLPSLPNCYTLLLSSFSSLFCDFFYFWDYMKLPRARNVHKERLSHSSHGRNLVIMAGNALLGIQDNAGIWREREGGGMRRTYYRVNVTYGTELFPAQQGSGKRLMFG